MRHVRRLTTTAQALQKVFDVPLKPSCRPSVCPALRSRTSSPFARRFSLANHRSAIYKPLTERANPAPRYREIDPSRFGPQSNIDRKPRDEEISARNVVIRLPNARLSEVRTLWSILAGRAKDEKGKFTQYVQVIAEADPTQNRPYPIVGYFGKKELKERELEKKQKDKESFLSKKSMELSWSITDHDLKYRMDKLHAFLQKGKRVEVLFGSKGWRIMKREISEDEAQSLLAKIQDAALQVPGTNVIQKFEGTLLRQGNMIFQGPMKKLNESVGESTESGEESKE